MEIKEAITKAKEMKEERKNNLLFQAENWERIESQEVNEDIMLKENKK